MKKIWILYPLSLVLSLFPAIYLNNSFGYIPFLFVVFLCLTSCSYALLLKLFLSFLEVSVPDNCSRGEEMAFAIKLKNNSLLIYPKISISFYISDYNNKHTITKNAILTLGSFEEKHFDFKMEFRHIGEFKIGINNIKIYDPFGYIFLPLKKNCEYPVLVTPKIFNYTEFMIKNQNKVENSISRQISPFDGKDYSELRDYVYGDSLKDIHWNVSARFQSLMTKQFETNASSGLSILMDFACQQKYNSEILMDIYDTIVETSLSLAHDAKKKHLFYQILYKKYGYTHTYAPKDFYNTTPFLHNIPKLNSDNPNDIIELLKEQYNINYAAEHIITCSSQINSELSKHLVMLKQYHKNPMFFLVLPEHVYNDDYALYAKYIEFLQTNQIFTQIIICASDLRKAV